jgi:hypothetical protein
VFAWRLEVGSGTVVVIVVVAVIVILAVVLLLSMRARRRRASASHHIGLPKLGSLSSAADQTTGGVDHVKDEGAKSPTQEHASNN